VSFLESEKTVYFRYKRKDSCNSTVLMKIIVMLLLLNVKIMVKDGTRNFRL